MFGKLKKLWLIVETLALRVDALQYQVDSLKKKPVAKKPVVKKTSK